MLAFGVAGGRAAGRAGLAYERLGHGGSDPAALPRPFAPPPLPAGFDRDSYASTALADILHRARHAPPARFPATSQSQAAGEAGRNH